MLINNNQNDGVDVNGILEEEEEEEEEEEKEEEKD